jgi:hypothetical protein
VPDHYLHRGDESRPILRAATSGLLPEEVRTRRDKGAFHAALDRALAPEKMRWAGSLLLDPEALWRGFVEESAVRRWLSGDLVEGWDKLGFLQCLFAELWRFHRAGGDLGELASR